MPPIKQKRKLNNVRQEPSSVRHFMCYFCGDMFTIISDYQRHIVEHQMVGICYQIYDDELATKLPRYLNWRKLRKEKENEADSTATSTPTPSEISGRRHTIATSTPSDREKEDKLEKKDRKKKDKDKDRDSKLSKPFLPTVSEIKEPKVDAHKQKEWDRKDKEASEKKEREAREKKERESREKEAKEKKEREMKEKELRQKEKEVKEKLIKEKKSKDDALQKIKVKEAHDKEKQREVESIGEKMAKVREELYSNSPPPPTYNCQRCKSSWTNTLKLIEHCVNIHGLDVEQIVVIPFVNDVPTGTQKKMGEEEECRMCGLEFCIPTRYYLHTFQFHKSTLFSDKSWTSVQVNFNLKNSSVDQFVLKLRLNRD